MHLCGGGVPVLTTKPVNRYYTRSECMCEGIHSYGSIGRVLLRFVSIFFNRKSALFLSISWGTLSPEFAEIPIERKHKQ